MRKPIHSDQEITEVGESLMAKYGRDITPNEIHKELDGKGKYGRIRDIWEGHMATRGDEQRQDDIPLPDTAQDQITTAVIALEQSMQGLVRDLIARITAQHIRQYVLQERDFAVVEAEHIKKVQTLEEEIAYLTGCLDDMEEEASGTGSETSQLTRHRIQEKMPALAAPAVVRKHPNRPIQKSRPPLPKVDRPNFPKREKAPGQPPTRS